MQTTFHYIEVTPFEAKAVKLQGNGSATLLTKKTEQFEKAYLHGPMKWTNQDPAFSHIRKNSKMFNITSKYLSFFNNKPLAS